MINRQVFDAMDKEEAFRYVRLIDRVASAAVDVSNESELLKNLYVDVVSTMDALQSAKEKHEESREDIKSFIRQMERKYKDVLPEQARMYYEMEGGDDKDN